MAPDFVIPVLGRVQYDVGADILALAAYPMDERKRQRFARAVLASQIQAALDENPTWRPGIPPSRYSRLPFEDLEKHLKDGIRKINDRFTAGKAAKPFVEEAVANRRGKRAGFPDGSPISKQEIFARIAAQDGEKKERSLATIWDESWPVIHLSVALIYAMPPEPKISVTDFLNLPPLPLLKCANSVRMVLALTNRPAPKRGPHSRPNFTDPGIYRVMWSRA
ncbi:MAG: hypothetical protein U1E93_03525 [Alphaproteobacteria bacterium]